MSKKNFATTELSLPNMPFNQCHLPVISTHSNKCYFWFLLFQTSDHFSGDIPGQARSKQNFGDSCSYIYIGQIPFLSLDQQHQNTEGKLKTLSKYFSHSWSHVSETYLSRLLSGPAADRFTWQPVLKLLLWGASEIRSSSSSTSPPRPADLDPFPTQHVFHILIIQ